MTRVFITVKLVNGNAGRMDIEMSAGQKIGIAISFAIGALIVYWIYSFYQPKGRR